MTRRCGGNTVDRRVNPGPVIQPFKVLRHRPQRGVALVPGQERRDGADADLVSTERLDVEPKPIEVIGMCEQRLSTGC